MRIVSLGTGASGGTPGRGRSQRRESSLLLSVIVWLVASGLFPFYRNQA